MLPLFFPSQLTASANNLRRVLGVRAVVFLGQLLSALYAQWIWGLDLRYGPIYGVLGLMLVVSLVTLWRLRQARPVSDHALLGQLLFDMLCLTLQLYFTGGANNPFVSWYLVPLAIAAVVLPVAHVLLIGALSLLAYSLLLFHYQPVSVLMPGHEHHAGPSLHILGMWFNFALSTALISAVVTRMASALRRQQQLLSQQREQTLRDEQILAVATLAAGTTHELGTPLGAVQLNLEEIAALHPQDPDLQREVEVALSQVQRCKAILRGLGRDADSHLQQEWATQPIAEFLQQVLERWRLLQPQARFTLDAAPTTAVLQRDSSLQQALINLLDNAGRASQQAVEVRLQRYADKAEISIRDHGPGIPLAQADQLGKTIVDGRGMGLGLLLSHATIERFGGSVRLFNHPNGGTLAQVTLPVQERQ